MFIYNVTSKVDWSIADQWEQWMKDEHIPAVMSTRTFTSYQFTKLLEVDDTEGPTYAVQYYMISKTSYDEYIQQHAPKLRDEMMDKWGNKMISFRSLMQVLA